MNWKEKTLDYFSKYMILIGVLGQTQFLFQTHKILTNHSSADVSLMGLTVAFVSLASWTFYGWLKYDWVLIKVNVFAMCAAIICISATLFYRV